MHIAAEHNWESRNAPNTYGQRFNQGLLTSHRWDAGHGIRTPHGRRICFDDFRGYSPSPQGRDGSRTWGCWLHFVPVATRKQRKPEVRPGQAVLIHESFPWQTTSSRKALYLLKVPWPPQTAQRAGDQANVQVWETRVMRSPRSLIRWRRNRLINKWYHGNFIFICKWMNKPIHMCICLYLIL